MFAAMSLCLCPSVCLCASAGIVQWRREGVCRPGKTSVLPPPPVRSAITDILIVTTMTLVWTVANSTLSWGCNYVMQIPAECKRQTNATFRILYFRPSKCRPLLSATRGACPSFPGYRIAYTVAYYDLLVAWHSGRTSVSGRRTFPVLRLNCS